MAADLAATPSSELRVQLCGDAHLSNFGGFAAPDRRLIFDMSNRKFCQGQGAGCSETHGAGRAKWERANALGCGS
jgi:hypothetical protein